MSLVKPLSKRRGRCELEELGDARLPVVPEQARLRNACARAWGRAPEWALLSAAPSAAPALAPEEEVVATTILEGGWAMAWRGTLLSRAVAKALGRPAAPVELRRPLTRFDCGAGAWVLTSLLTDWLGDEAPGIVRFEPGWQPPRPLPPWRMEVAWRCWERGRLWIFSPIAPSATEAEPSPEQRARIEGWPMVLRPRLDRVEMSPGTLETLRPGDLLPLPRMHWRDGRLCGQVELSAGPVRRQAWFEAPPAPAAPVLRLGGHLDQELHP